MSLFTDRDFVTREMMLALDSEVAEVASSENITIEGDYSVIRQAWEECANTLIGRTVGFHGQRLVQLNQIVVDDALVARMGHIERWMLARAFVLFYQNAIARTVEDRYKVKLELHELNEKKHWRGLYDAGVQILHNPLPCPGALREISAGLFGESNITASGTAATTQTSVDVAITWLDSRRYVSATYRQNGESGPSQRLSFLIPDGKLLSVNIAGLTAPPFATHWNLYVGPAGGQMYLQNANPIPILTSTFTLSGEPVFGGIKSHMGQVPESNLILRNQVPRG